MPTTPPSITALPAVPDRADRATFSTRATNYFDALKNTFTAEVQAVAANAYANAVDSASAASSASSSASTANTHASTASSAATLAQAWATQASTPVSGGLYSAKYYAEVAQGVVATIPEGTINDATTSTTGVWSSSKVSASVAAKQDTLVSGTNIKTINGTSVLGAGDLEVGFRNIPQNSQSSAYTLVLADSGKHILHPSADTTARTFTIPANSSVAFPVGTAITFVNQNGAGAVTIAITTDTMRLAGAGTTGSRTLAANGVATAVKVTSTEWIISGTGLT